MKIKKIIFSIINFVLIVLGLTLKTTNYLDRNQVILIFILIFVVNILIFFVKNKKSVINDILDVSTFLINTLVFLLIINNFVLFTSLVEGSSMEPTILAGDRLYINKFLINIEVNDIVVYKTSDDYIVKRVAAVEGDVVSVILETNELGTIIYYLTINDDKYQNKYGEYYEVDIMDVNNFYLNPYQLKTDEIILLGDNSTKSQDSRQMGILNMANVVGERIGRSKWTKICVTNK